MNIHRSRSEELGQNFTSEAGNVLSPERRRRSQIQCLFSETIRTVYLSESESRTTASDLFLHKTICPDINNNFPLLTTSFTINESCFWPPEAVKAAAFTEIDPQHVSVTEHAAVGGVGGGRRASMGVYGVWLKEDAGWEITLDETELIY